MDTDPFNTTAQCVDFLVFARSVITVDARAFVRAVYKTIDEERLDVLQRFQVDTTRKNRQHCNREILPDRMTSKELYIPKGLAAAAKPTTKSRQKIQMSQYTRIDFRPKSS